MRVDDPSVLPLSDSATANPNDKVVGVDFSGGMASVVAQINSALGSTGLQFSNPAGTTLRVLDDGAGGKVDVNAAVGDRDDDVAHRRQRAELPFFLDGTKPYSGAITGLGSQSVGFAGRITVNPALLADPSRLVVYQTSPLTSAGDATRPNFMLDRLTSGVLDFAPQAGIGTASAPFSGSLQSYMRQMISQQGEAAATADSLRQGQEVVVNSLQQRFADQSNVNIDEEMANLLKLQTAYGANARVLSAVQRHARPAAARCEAAMTSPASDRSPRSSCSRSATCARSSATCSASSAPARSRRPMRGSASSAASRSACAASSRR